MTRRNMRTGLSAGGAGLAGAGPMEGAGVAPGVLLAEEMPEPLPGPVADLLAPFLGPLRTQMPAASLQRYTPGKGMLP